MKEFKSLNAEGLPDAFDVNVHGDEPIVDVDDSKGIIVVSYTFPGFYLSGDSRDVEGGAVSFTQINIGKTGFLAESGKPLLPSFGRYVQIPFNCDYKITVRKGEPVEFDGVLVLPAQQEMTDSSEDDQGFEYDKSFYTRDELYPSEVVEITGPFEIDGYNSLLVHVRPIQYNPARRKLFGFANISVIIDVTPKDGESDESAFSDPESDREAYGNFFLNPRRRIEERLRIPAERRVVIVRPRGPEFIIIYDPTFKGAAQKLAKWKNTRGLRTAIVSIGTVGNSVSSIKNYIRNKRTSFLSRLRYVLFFGDVDMITSENIPGGPFDPNISDYYYSTKTDPVGSQYLLPWLSIGRIPVRTAAEGMDVVNQIIRYEKNPPCDPEYYRRMVVAAYFQDDNNDNKADRAYMKTMEAIREHLVTLGLDVERVYVSGSSNPQQYIDDTPVPAEVRNSIVDGSMATDMLISATAEGQLIAGHRDHGGSSGWSHPSFTKTHLEAITSEYPTIFYSINCLTGEFDLPAPTESFAEAILRMKGGAPSLVAATRLSGTFRNDSLMKALFDAMWAGILPTFPGSTASYAVRYNRLGDILNYAKSYLPVKHSGDTAGIKDHLEIYHVVGDPTIELWKAYPICVAVQVIRRLRDLNIKLAACPKGSVLTIWYGGKMLKRIQPSSTHLKISLKDLGLFPPIPPLPPRRRVVSVCFWAPGCRFRQVNVRI